SLELRRSDRSRRLREARAAQSETHLVVDDSDSARLISRVDEALATLPESLRTLVTEHFLCGRSQTELAEKLGINQSTVQRRIEKGLLQLRKRLHEDDDPEFRPSNLLLVLAGLRQTTAPEGLRHSLIKIGLSGARGGAVSLGTLLATFTLKKLITT